MKDIKVVAAIICARNAEGERIVFATQRGYGTYKDGWEFPGGKVEAGESPEGALVREIREELETEVEVGEHLVTVEHDYPEFHLSMDCFFCTINRGDLVLREHEAARWLTLEQIWEVDWLPADVKVVEAVLSTVNH